MDPYHLEREELVYELNLRGITEISGTRGVLPKMVSEAQRAEQEKGIVHEWAAWLIECYLARFENNLADLETMLCDKEDFEYLPREIYSRLWHYEARIQRGRPTG